MCARGGGAQKVGADCRVADRADLERGGYYQIVGRKALNWFSYANGRT